MLFRSQFETSPTLHHAVDRRTDGQVGAHSRVHGDQADLEGVVEIGVVGDGAVEDRLAVLVLADLQERCVARRLDEVAGRVHHEQPHAAVGHLAGHKDGRVETPAVLFQALAVEAIDLAHGAAECVDHIHLLRRELIGELMCQFELDTQAFAKAHQIDFDQYFAAELAELRDLQDAGLLEWQGSTIIVPTKGRLLVRRVAMAFDAHLRHVKTEAKYSKVV